MGVSWFVCPQPRPSATLRLFCFPHAGGGAAFFHPFAALLPESIEIVAVRLPGRETRLAEPPYRRMVPLIDDLSQAMHRQFGKPCAFFCHSMGALVAFELARALRRQGAPLPGTIIVSGRRAPTVPSSEVPLHGLPDEAFVQALTRRYAAIPKVIRDEPELMALFIPVMKADFATFETHAHRDEPPLPCALATYGGRDDPQTRQMDGWRDLFAGPCRERLFDGGHFYLAADRRAVAAALEQDVLTPAFIG